jgi:hypothetical protein
VWLNDQKKDNGLKTKIPGKVETPTNFVRLDAICNRLTTVNPKIVKTIGLGKHSIRLNYCAVDPTVKHALRSPQPILWTDGLFASTAEFWEEARLFGLR